MKPFNPASRGFTLAELLVVVAIIAILIVLAFPIIRKSLAAVRNTECLANLKDAGRGFHAYMNDNDYTLPRVSIAATPTSPVSNWVYLVTGFGTNGHDYMNARVGPNLVTLARKADGHKSPLLCTQNALNVGSPRNSTATTYAMNNKCSSLRLMSALEPSKSALLVESVPTSAGGFPISVSPGSPLTSVNVHGNHGNVLYLDGHVASITEIPVASSIFWEPTE